MQRKRLFSPLTWPVYSFLGAIAAGTALLCLPASLNPGQELHALDACFLATSAVCVTGLAPVDISSVLSPFGQGVMLFLIQLGGLGVMTYTSIIFLLWRNYVPFTSREAVSQALLGGGFNLAAFLRQVLALVFGIEALTAVLLYLHDPRFFHPFSAIFHAVSSFCNAGFALSPDNLMAFRDDPVVNLVIAGSVILGGIGFAVLREFLGLLSGGRLGEPVRRLSRFSRLVVKTSIFLIAVGTVLIFCIEFFRAGNEQSVGDGFDLVITSFFQSVIARTAGFNSVDMAALSEASLIVTRALTLFFLYAMLIAVSTFLLSITENGILHRTGREGVSMLRLLFETVSALGTVGLSVNLTPHLSAEGKVIIIFNMFAGRVGLLSLLMAVQSLQPRKAYAVAESQLPIG